MGSRNYRLPTHGLSKEHAVDLVSSIEIAYKNNHPLNRHLTINLEQVCPNGTKQTLKLFLDQYRKFCARRGLTPAYLWVLENNLGDNVHAHILMHLPPDSINQWPRVLRRKLKSSWYETSSLDVTKSRDWFKLQSINYGRGKNIYQFSETCQQLKLIYQANNNSATEQANNYIESFRVKWGEDFQFRSILTLANYLLKGLNNRQQGKVFGRRFGCSRNLIQRSLF